MSINVTPKFQSVSDLRDSIVSGGNVPKEYADKMMHKVPDLPVVKDRARYLVEKAKDRVVLDIGCTGPISVEIRKVAKTYYGVDQVQVEGCEVADLDHRPDLIPKHADVEVVICSEFLEHLANPGYFLLALKEHYKGREIYITVPNAGAYVMKDDFEMVNKEHVCWYSYTTLKTLLTRYGFEIKQARWYNGQPYKAEGIIVVVE